LVDVPRFDFVQSRNVSVENHWNAANLKDTAFDLLEHGHKSLYHLGSRDLWSWSLAV
jgi:hypothetical protein